MVSPRLPTAFVGLTDADWLEHLRTLSDLDEVNFWQPSPHGFSALVPGEPFIFKLHAKQGGLAAGVAFFVKYIELPVSIAWEYFGPANGASSLAEMRDRVERYRRVRPDPLEDYRIGCVMLSNPVFFDPADRFPVPGWHPSIQVGRRYPLVDEPGLGLWARVQGLISARAKGDRILAVHEAPAQRYGTPIFLRPRLGQATFKAVVLEAYDRRCSVTGEKVLPTLEAAHIRPFAEGGEHRIDNGLLLRRDLHALFDRGYLTVTPDLEVRVSRRLRTDFNNGEEYMALSGRPLRSPVEPTHAPNPEFLEWHNQKKFKSVA
ncbi:MAG TPA: HNH endonuclease [Acidimicrobiales bacterium]|jgi:putative restriction endonuclease|nr:HNH endonuclease [Acidimicrobiales bacterium]